MRVQVEPDVAAFAEACKRRFVELAAESIASHGQFVVALTGGSTPVPIHRALRDAPVDWSRVQVLFGDERAVPPDDERSNYRAAREAFLSTVPARVHRIEAERPDLHAVALEYERTLLQTCGGVIDLLFVGLGADAHVLSLWPGCPALEAPEPSDPDAPSGPLVVATIDPPMNPAVSRVTMTPTVVARARHVLGIATGEGKRQALDRALHAPDAPSTIPAHVLRRAQDLLWIVDRAAVS